MCVSEVEGPAIDVYHEKLFCRPHVYQRYVCVSKEDRIVAAFQFDVDDV